MNQNYSTKNISSLLLNEIKEALKSVSDYGSIEIYVQGGSVTQITTRRIKKTSGHAITGKPKTNSGYKKDLS